MRIDDSSPIASYAPRSPAGTPAAESSAFAKVMEQAQAAQDNPTVLNPAAPQSLGATAQPSQPAVRSIKNGDTLSHIVRQEAQSRGVQLSGAQEFRSVMALAKDNGIANPNRIFVGQQLNMGSLHAQWADPASELMAQKPGAGLSSGAAQNTAPSTQAVLNAKSATSAANTTSAAPKPIANPQAQANQATTTATTTSTATAKAPPAPAHPVLRQTLDRAVARGFIPANEKQDVYNKILQVANKHKFSPDDFARLTLMESDGMNPQATNQRCHGIIQFCDGPARGAASVGFGHAPRAIQGLSVYQQLHLVDTYFDKVGLNKQGQVPLDELYLAVLQPSARAETRPEVPLGIPGNQAHVLYEGRNPQSSITRNSIMQGLVQNTWDRLGNVGHNISNALPTRLQAQRSAEYRAIDNPDSVQR